MNLYRCTNCGSDWDLKKQPTCPKCLSSDWVKNPYLITKKHNPNLLPNTYKQFRSVIANEIANDLPKFLGFVATNGTCFFSESHQDYFYYYPKPINTIPGSAIPANLSSPTGQLEGLIVALPFSQPHLYAANPKDIQSGIDQAIFHINYCDEPGCQNLAFPWSKKCESHRFTIINFKEMRDSIKSRLLENYKTLIELSEYGFSLFLFSIEILSTTTNKFDINTAEGSSKFAVWRFASTFQSSYHWCLVTAINGDLVTAKQILRLCLEESIKANYYSLNPIEALKQIQSRKQTDEIKFEEMIDTLKLNKTHLMRIWGDLSNYYSHANLNLPHELLISNEGEIKAFGGGSRYIPERFEEILKDLLFLLADFMSAIARSFPQLKVSKDWKNRYFTFIEKVKKC